MIVDAYSGRVLRLGDSFPTPEGTESTLVAANVGVFRGWAVLLREGREVTTPLVVRWMHPKYPFRRVAFIPS